MPSRMGEPWWAFPARRLIMIQTSTMNEINGTVSKQKCMQQLWRHLRNAHEIALDEGSRVMDPDKQRQQTA